MHARGTGVDASHRQAQLWAGAASDKETKEQFRQLCVRNQAVTDLNAAIHSFFGTFFLMAVCTLMVYLLMYVCGWSTLLPCDSS